MKINLEINNLAKSPVKKSFLEITIRKTLQEAGFAFGTKNIVVSLALVSQSEIKKLNRQYRKINKATDILSFSEYKNAKEIKKDPARELFLGELILCYDEVKSYAQKQKIPVKKELAEVLAHGLLHLLGFRHGKKMFAIQKSIANKVTK